MKGLKPWQWAAFIALGLIAAGILLLGFLPAPADPYVAPEDYGAGAGGAAYDPAGDALPPVASPAFNPATPEKEQLGYLLFFDPYPLSPQ